MQTKINYLQTLFLRLIISNSVLIHQATWKAWPGASTQQLNTISSFQQVNNQNYLIPISIFPHTAIKFSEI